MIPYCQQLQPKYCKSPTLTRTQPAPTGIQCFKAEHQYTWRKFDLEDIVESVSALQLPDVFDSFIQVGIPTRPGKNRPQ